MQILKKNQLFHLVGSVTTLALVTLLVALLLPVVGMGANAEGEVSDRASTRINISSSPVVSIALDKSVSLEFTPKTSGEFQQSSAKLTVSTNNTDGYRILLSSSNNNAALTSTSQTAKINSIVGMNVLPAAFTDNSWGYSLVNASTTPTSYNAVPTTDTEILNVETGKVIEGHADTYDLNFGARVSTSLPAGNYSGEVVVSAVANPIKLHSLMDVTYMQDMTSSICANTPILEDKKNPVSKQLVDTRDGKKYWVSKLADGNCWMVQNLAYDITEERINSGAINPTNTDVTETWGKDSQYPPMATKTGALNFDGVDKNVYTQTYSWNLGEYVIVDPTVHSWDSIKAGGTLDGVKNVAKYNGSQDQHNLFGNYYQWNAATAGSGAAVTADEDNLKVDNAMHSICPKGWQLPLAEPARIKDATGAILPSRDQVPTLKNKSYAYLFSKYGFTYERDESDWTGPGSINPSSQGYYSFSAPFHFVRTGDVGNESLSSMNGWSWTLSSSTTSHYNQAYRFSAGSDRIYPLSTGSRTTASSVRCVAR